MVAAVVKSCCRSDSGYGAAARDWLQPAWRFRDGARRFEPLGHVYPLWFLVAATLLPTCAVEMLFQLALSIQRLRNRGLWLA